MITIIMLYKSAVIPSLRYGCETWIPYIELSITRKIDKAPKAPKSTLIANNNRFPNRQKAYHIS